MTTSRLPLTDTVCALADALIRSMGSDPANFSRVDRDAISSEIRKAREHEERARRLAMPATATDTTPPKRQAPARGLVERLFFELLPRDGRPHPCAPIVETMLSRGVSLSSIHRGRRKLGIGPADRVRQFHATGLWCWPPLVSGNGR